MPVSEPIQIRIAGHSEEDHIRSAYESLGYRRELKLDTATVWMAERAGRTIGIVRIAEESGTLVLRGMRVAGPYQRKRIGSQLLIAMAAWLGDRECYCVPYAHLTGFYGQIGFVEVDSACAPAFLAERLREYRQSGLDVLLMRRAHSDS